MWQSIAIFCAVLVTVQAQATQVSQCINHSGELPIQTYVGGCDVPPCVLPQLQDAMVDIVFKAPRTLKSMTTLVTAYLSVYGVPVPAPYPLQENSITCNFLMNTYCPIVKDEVVRYTLKMYVESFFPVGTVATLEFRVVDEKQEPVICIRVDIRVVAAIEEGSNRNATLLIDHA